MTKSEQLFIFLGKILAFFLLIALSPLFLLLSLISYSLKFHSNKIYELEKEELYIPPKIDNLLLPKEIGVVISEFQVNGSETNIHSSWSHWEKGKFKNGKPHIEHGYQSGKSLNYWDHPLQAIDKLKALGIKHFRFSIEWSLIEPSSNRFDQTILEHYHRFIDLLKANDITPWIMLHHFSDPQWFLDIGGFEKEENIVYFIRYCKKAFSYLSPFVSRWGTINEPTSYAFQGYLRGVYPPGKKSPSTSAHVLKNLLIAHVRAYQELKNIQPNVEIGITHNVLRFRPYSANPIEQLASYYSTKITHTSLFDFFRTGIFRYELPLITNLVYEMENPSQYLDFFGLQYYCDPLIRMTLKRPFIISSHHQNEEMTHMPFRFYPQGLKTAIEECSALKTPLIISEIGVDTTEKKRVDFFKTVFKITSEALEKGVDIRGVYIWTLQDNFEWDYGWSNHFGLYSFNPISKLSNPREVCHFIKNLLQKKQKLCE